MLNSNGAKILYMQNLDGALDGSHTSFQYWNRLF